MNVPLFPLHTVLFPGMVLPLHIFEPRYRRMVHACLEAGTPFGVVLIRSGREVGGPAVPFTTGTLAHIRHVEHLADGRMNIEAVGEERFRLVQLYAAQEEVHTADITPFPLQAANQPAAYAAARALVPWLVRYLALLGQAARTTFEEKPLPSDPASLAYFAAMVAQVPTPDKQDLLSTANAADLLLHVRALYRRETSLLRAMLSTAQSHAGELHCPN